MFNFLEPLSIDTEEVRLDRIDEIGYPTVRPIYSLLNWLVLETDPQSPAFKFIETYDGLIEVLILLLRLPDGRERRLVQNILLNLFFYHPSCRPGIILEIELKIGEIGELADDYHFLFRELLALFRG